MRRRLLFGALCTSIVASLGLAQAKVTQPNGQVMPRDSQNGEVQLYTLFQDRGEPLDFQADGNTTPDVFSPLCGFSAELVLNQTASHLGVGWYNVIPNAAAPPGPADIHIIVPANSPVGTKITAADIKSNPAYAGGLIGFAIIGFGFQIHYSEAKWDMLCTGCAPPKPWITAVIYPSKITPNAYYVGFEDGNVGAMPNQFNNDGDYNDYVYFFTGLVCSGGGQDCETAKPGVCSPGLTQCDGSCKQLVPEGPEKCNGLDDNCDGTTDEGNLCDPGYVCDKGTCVKGCSSGEFSCPPDKACSKDGYCVDLKCVDVSCEAGKVCIKGNCVAACDGILCPKGRVCRVGKCVEPCAGVACNEGQVCDKGVCKTSCSCAPCTEGLSCDPASGLCKEPKCVGLECQLGGICVAGSCVDACFGAVCPGGQICDKGDCIGDPNAGGGGPGGTSGSDAGNSGGFSAFGAFGGSAASSGAGDAPDAVTTSGGTANNDTRRHPDASTSGCGCRSSAEDREPAPGFFAVALLSCAMLVRRRARGTGRSE